jgi:small nuclear ribonucleoprotein D3
MPTVGIPVKLVHEAEGHIITVELVTGELYRGQMVEAEDTMNLSLCNVTCTGRDGRISKLDHIYIRGSKIRFMIMPDMLKNAPMFKRLGKTKGAPVGHGLGVGRGVRSGVGGPPLAGRGRAVGPPRPGVPAGPY